MEQELGQQIVSVSSTISLWTKRQRKPENDNKCGLFNFYPKWLQKMATPRSFLVCFCIKNILQGMIFTYIVGIETSLERHFQLDGKSIGLLLTLGEIGPIVTAVWISHSGSRGNRPRWMAIGLLLIALSLTMCYFMYLIFPPPSSILDDGQFIHVETTCRQNNSSVLLTNPRCTIDPVRRRWAFAAWVFIYSLLGIGATTIYVIGAPYMDDSISNKESPFYFSITMAVRIVGPVLGYLLSSACLKLYVDINKNPGWKSNDPRWIGAWWLGALIIAGMISLFSLVLGSFPRVMKRKSSNNDENITNCGTEMTTSTVTLDSPQPDKITNEKKDRKTEFKNAILRLLRNPVLLCSCGSSVFTILGLAGYFIWLPKYFEHEFRLSKSNSAMYSGLSGNLTMILGVLLSGYLMKRYSPTSGQVAAFVAGTKYVYAFGLIIIMVLADCGVMTDLPGTLEKDGSLTLKRECNDNCNCNTVEYLPTCLRGQSGQQTYFSPCHAGCTGFSTVNETTLYNSCICDPQAEIVPGFCKGTCNNLYTYMVLLAIVKLIISFSAVGNLIIDLRCVEERDKALALGFLAAISGLLGFLPNPIIYGSLIDSSCLVWETSCGERGSCWVYDTDGFRYKLHGLTSACLIIAGGFEVLTYFKVKGLDLFKNDNC